MPTLYAMVRLWKPRSNSRRLRRTIAGFVRRGDVLVIGTDARGGRVFKLPEVGPCAS
jgi:ribosomal protein S28E/S33